MKRLTIITILWSAALLSAMAQFALPRLPYGYGALEPYIDSATMYIHYNNHHAAYVANLNKAVDKYPELKKKSLEELLANLSEIPSDVRATIRNSGGGHYNHTFFWSVLCSPAESKISEKLTGILSKNFGSVDLFKAEFEKAAAERFGSGWVWLIKEPNGRLRIISTPNQDNPVMGTAEVKGIPVLALDVWEHAYYLKYQSKRAAYAKAFWNVVNWKEVEKNISE